MTTAKKTTAKVTHQGEKVSDLPSELYPLAGVAGFEYLGTTEEGHKVKAANMKQLRKVIMTTYTGMGVPDNKAFYVVNNKFPEFTSWIYKGK